MVWAMLAAGKAWAKPKSVFGGVEIGIIISPTNFTDMPLGADEILKNLVEVGISGIEIQDVRVETYAGAPGAARASYQSIRGEAVAATAADVKEARRKAAEEIKQWRLAASMDKYIDLRKKYHDAGVHMYAFRLATLSNATTDAELNYFFNTAEALGAHQITVELPTDTALTQRVGDFAAKRKIWMGYHNHTRVNFNSWDTALAQSKYNGINFDVGHFTAAASQSRIPFIRKYHERITCLHLKAGSTRATAARIPYGETGTRR
jgi:sugar phosphate isomerase/epimerase